MKNEVDYATTPKRSVLIEYVGALVAVYNNKKRIPKGIPMFTLSQCLIVQCAAAPVKDLLYPLKT